MNLVTHNRNILVNTISVNIVFDNENNPRLKRTDVHIEIQSLNVLIKKTLNNFINLTMYANRRRLYIHIQILFLIMNLSFINRCLEIKCH